MRSRGTDPGRPMDLGWLFMLPGVVLIAAGVLIAAEDDLYAARFRRDEALAIERRHADRVERYRVYLQALERQDPTVVRSLVVSQLNAAPTDLVEARIPGVPVYDSTEVFSSLEPPPPEPPERVRVDSVLARWATDNSSRMWLLASGALCVFVGLLPPANRSVGAVAMVDGDQEAGEFEDEAPGVEDADGQGLGAPDGAEGEEEAQDPIQNAIGDEMEDDAPDDDAERAALERPEDAEDSEEPDDAEDARDSDDQAEEEAQDDINDLDEDDADEDDADEVDEDEVDEDEVDEDDPLDGGGEDDEAAQVFEGFEQVEDASDDADDEGAESEEEAEDQAIPPATGQSAGPPGTLFDTLRDPDA